MDENRDISDRPMERPKFPVLIGIFAITASWALLFFAVWLWIGAIFLMD